MSLIRPGDWTYSIEDDGLFDDTMSKDCLKGCITSCGVGRYMCVSVRAGEAIV